ncbi:50S ribosomal protein L23 [Desertifilum sp. FACHB-1129]|uniref:50S ribosomal protein L23 n=2 Tax=Desertifilum tharense IPPAS B-1220 TaxID=1781255 RepID=A0ACD5GUQ3_9CYAN|nr:50S ribosomal protein L23 [Desertifilum tharense]MBD2314233.1 50S ribosomal protein L23 [Desertifilum sp. FACHB-1129]MBD2324681.1 50S ribosomal protein L23 [Desertifilum sp. FACHB-866]MBD2334764.1 50S ribosomal protein L23 [Desertifilum sp. FACHB-868]MCD8486976.1 50S ribosomal protein L23 [Desertifilum sp.]MDA0211495.1 50S ribosomal protein L23 [Cyanobacteria bacterium FC1]MDI9639567.1 50S ribosomal protein L23 [Geitlerinema splendidum]MDK3162362.1 50S ribosomal protein L23 [Kamptonema co
MSEFDPRDLPDLVRRPMITEKATRLLEDNKYTFEVALKASKPQIKAAIEELFDVSVVKVNTCRPPRRKRRVGKFLGYKSQYKKAVVTLAAGDTITLFPEV